MNGRAFPGAYLFRLYVCDKEMSCPHHIGETHQPDWVVYLRDSQKFRLTNVIPERIIFVSRGITVYTIKSRSQRPRGLRPLAHWDCGFESHPGHGCLSVVSVVCCQVEVSAADWSLVQRSRTDCGASLCVIKKPRKKEEAKARYRAVKNTTTMGCNARKTYNK